jgi:hypothetical protein
MAGTLTTPPPNAPGSQANSQRKVNSVGHLSARLSAFIELLGSSAKRIWGWIRTCGSAVIGQFRKVSRKLRIGAAVAAVLLIGVGIFFWQTAASARLRITCQHTLRSAELSVSVDSKMVYSGTVSGTTKKRFGVFNSRSPQGTFSKTVAVRPGKHTVQVRLSSSAENYDQTKTQTVTFSDNKENSLTVSGGRRGLYMLAQGGFTPPAETPGSPYQKYTSPILFSILGSGLSATISFLVQEFLRSQKARLANSNSAAQAKS